MSTFFRGSRARARSASAAVALAWIGACRIAPPEVHPEQDVARASGIEPLVRLEVHGGPLDAALPERAAGGTGDPATLAIADAPATLALADALAASLRNDPGLQMALARVRVAEAEADLAGRAPNPVLDLVLRWPEGGGRLDIEAGLSADLVALLQRPGRARAAGHRLRREAARALVAALDLLEDVQRRYSDAQALEQALAALARRAELLERLRALSQARLDQGEGTLQDVGLLDLQRGELALERGARQRELRGARLALAQRIGAPSDAATWALEPWSSPPPVPADEQAWIDAALASRPELVAIGWEVRAREEEEALARGGSLAGSAAGVDAERQDDWSAGPRLALPLPLFDTGDARAASASALTSEERHRFTQAARGVVLDTRSALAALVGAQADLERVTEELVPLGERRRAELEQAFRAGAVDAFVWLAAEQALQEVHARRGALEREVATSRHRLERAVGGPSAFGAVLLAQGAQP